MPETEPVARVTADEIAQQLPRVSAEVIARASEGLRALGKSIAGMGKALNSLNTSLPAPPPLDMSPRAVALRARQNRNTGPVRRHGRRR
jgi:hypothetical protein